MILPLVSPEHPLLKTKLEWFDFQNPPVNVQELVNSLIETLVHYKGLGLSANQCGLPYRVFVLRSNPTKVLFNPVISDSSSEEIRLEEGCLTYPGLLIKVKRPKFIRVRYTNEFGEAVTDKFTGITARCVLHEMDHLNGLDFIGRAHPHHKTVALRQWKKISKQNI